MHQLGGKPDDNEPKLLPGPKPRILCVDDEVIILRGLKRLLETQYDVEIASSGQEGIDHLFRDASFAVVMADYRMPEMDGVEFLRNSRALSPLSARLMLTAHGDAVALRVALENELILRILQKPFEPSVLRGAIRDAVEWHVQRQKT